MTVVLSGAYAAAHFYLPLNHTLHPLFSFGVEEPKLRFVGRKKELNELTAALKCDTERLWVVAGPEGMGKSQLMKQFLNNIKHEHNCVWLLGESVQTLSSSVNSLFKRLQILDHGSEGQMFSEPMQGTVEYIRNCSNKRPWTFVIDNVDENHSTAITVVTALVKLSNIKIFITSRLRHIVGGSGVIMEVKPLSDEDAKSFVNNSLPPNQRPELVSNLCMTLQNHPLALSQAVDYIRNEQSTSVKEHYSIEDYLNTFRSQSSKLLKHEVLDEHTTVFHTCSISMKILEKKHGKAGQYAKSLLRRLAYFDPNGVPRPILIQFLTERTFKSETLVEDGLGLLKSFSLIWIKGEIITVHRLVQQVVLIEIQNLWWPNQYIDELFQVSRLLLCDKRPWSMPLMKQISSFDKSSSKMNP
jgi:ABC-type cobalamin/Fe3+-siderophores transport system ATPase subunit